MKGKFVKSRSADCYKMPLSWVFLAILEFHGEFWIKVDEDTQLSFMDICKYRNQRVRGEKNGRSFKSVSKTKKRKNTWSYWDS